MRNLILLLLAAVSCGPTDPISAGHDNPPAVDCDYTEYDTGPDGDLLLAQLITTLPALSERTICGDFTNEFEFPVATYDYDEFLFPMVTLGEPVIFNLEIECEPTHIPLMQVYYMNEVLEEPILVGDFIGSPGFLYVLKWPFSPMDTFKNDLIVQVSGYSNDLSPTTPYEIKFW